MFTAVTALIATIGLGAVSIFAGLTLPASANRGKRLLGWAGSLIGAFGIIFVVVIAFKALLGGFGAKGMDEWGADPYDSELGKQWRAFFDLGDWAFWLTCLSAAALLPVGALLKYRADREHNKVLAAVRAENERAATVS